MARWSDCAVTNAPQIWMAWSRLVTGSPPAADNAVTPPLPSRTCSGPQCGIIPFVAWWPRQRSRTWHRSAFLSETDSSGTALASTLTAKSSFGDTTSPTFARKGEAEPAPMAEMGRPADRQFTTPLRPIRTFCDDPEIGHLTSPFWHIDAAGGRPPGPPAVSNHSDLVTSSPAGSDALAGVVLIADHAALSPNNCWRR